MVDYVLPALAVFSAAASISPGPNNIMLMASGTNFGFIRSLPHLIGVSAGVFAITSLIGLGLMPVFDACPALQTVLRIVAAIYLVWLAYRIAFAVPAEATARTTSPLTFFQSAAFQGVNPKIWATGSSVVTLFAGDRQFTSILTVAIAFALIGMVSNAIWAGMGTALRHWLSAPRLRAFNIAMALLLVVSIYPMLFR